MIPSLESLDVGGLAEETSAIFKMLGSASQMRKLKCCLNEKLAEQLQSEHCELPHSIEHLEVSMGPPYMDRAAGGFEVLMGTTLPNLKTAQGWNAGARSVRALRRFPDFKISVISIDATALPFLDEASSSGLPKLRITREKDAQPKVQDHFSKFPALEELHLTSFYGEYSHSSAEIPQILANAPQSLRRLEIDMLTFNLPTNRFDTAGKLLENQPIRLVLSGGWHYLGVSEGERTELDFWRSLPNFSWSRE
jgi:hypothetical protein